MLASHALLKYLALAANQPASEGQGGSWPDNAVVSECVLMDGLHPVI